MKAMMKYVQIKMCYIYIKSFYFIIHLNQTISFMSSIFLQEKIDSKNSDFEREEKGN